ncbi:MULTISPECIES: fimbria/pilus outer membrane usher protein [unclassified Tatumella]|uniref:fimbria/pilus outer membrane usher protein n=1 Tax=unclassified Tatumella TaxID=2649542 RepID=UPI001BB04305|nr:MULTISPECIES: fimbria/pilus outer membrane usher protein [unclassified Tatumella]MBS0854714.1 fimbrial biogenesis outer membrane usher protein [Tatumella sp. JGM16]MBS0892504.1 fimbrial biogenesis outer membrane usher protein [Tatumella sp. JGM130]MBS0911418.1 fimbrial biogenesis outer membrane usher protein [Tatumella sp. JGM91]
MQRLRPYQLSARKLSLLSAVFLLPVSFCAVSDEVLYLTVSVNDAAVPGLFQIRKSGDHFFISAQDFKQLNIRTDKLATADNTVDMVSGGGLSLVYDDLQQQLNIRATVDWLAGHQKLTSQSNGLITRQDFSPRVKGIAFDYNLYSAEQPYSQSLSAYTDLRSFGIGPGNFSTSFNSRFNHSDTGTDNGTRRLMSAWSYNNTDKLLSLTLGDSYTGSQSWTNSVRFAGVSLAHNYALQPDFNTSTQDILSDTVALPSTVDLYVQGIRQTTQHVEPGQFTLNTAPVFTGNSSAQVVITDINGQQRVVNLNIYGSDLLLSRGLNSWSINAGWLRKDYSYRSFSYNPGLMVTGNGRYGLRDDLTLEAHTEQGEPLQNGGIGANYLLSPWLGIVHGDISASRHNRLNGKQWGVGWQWSNRHLSFSLTDTRRDSHYRDMSVLTEGELATRSDNAFISWSMGAAGTVGASWINRQYAGETRSYAGFSWSGTFRHNINISASLTRALEMDHDKTLYLSVSVPLSDTQYVSVQHSQDSQSANNQLTWSKSVISNKPGWGGDVSLQNGSNATTHLDYRQRTEWSDLELGYNRYSQQNNYYASLSGTAGLFANAFYATRQLGDGFALVDTDGIAGIPVYLEHQPVGKTDRDGKLFLNNLLPYYRNNISIDVLSLPDDFRALYTEDNAIPESGGGAMVHFRIYRARALLMTVKQTQGKALPFAAPVSVVTAAGQQPETGTRTTVVGYEGNIYLENPPAEGFAIVHLPDSTCRIRLPAQLPAGKAITTMEAVCQ